MNFDIFTQNVQIQVSSLKKQSVPNLTFKNMEIITWNCFDCFNSSQLKTKMFQSYDTIERRFINFGLNIATGF